ncbi:hypothetical protein [Xenorhabdus littoralis]|uniref:hypothetical protein n=1 Tax=Xenorhabdus littoralis TaxID=2582835 RepID=UPI0029E7EEFB|nr:hypothetical protein [Xenorhabdus sp. psl]MDX7992611.1 hypothetical protein [Xenorhabdus sp. psl]
MEIKDKVKIQKSADYKSYFAENCGIVGSSIDGAELYDIVILNKESSPVLLNGTVEDDKWVARLALETQYQHVCSIRVTSSMLRKLKDVIDNALLPKK